MNLVTLSENRTVRIAAIVIAASLIAGSAAIFVFKVAPNTVLSVGLIGLFIASHLFMHGGHSGHGENEDHTQHTLPANQSADAVAKTDQKNNQTGHSGCH
jgi:hypothetical protein